jgi:thiol-disulfide isomerase/thioredoxin
VSPPSRAPGGPVRALRWTVLFCFLAALLYLELPGYAAGPPIEWRSDLEAALAEAAAESRPAVLSFHAAWCPVCRKLDARSLRAPQVAAELERFVRVRVDASGADPTTAKLLERFDVRGLPALRFVAPGGALLDEPRLLGFVGPEPLARLLRGIGAAAAADDGGGPASRSPALARSTLP